MNLRNLRYLRLVLLAGLIGLVGCSASRPVYPVEGKVTFPDGKPLTMGSIEFQLQDPESKAPLNGNGSINSEGEYSISAFIGGRVVTGLPEGTYRVIIVSMPPEGRTYIDPRYMDFGRSGLEFTVKPEKNIFNIRVTKPETNPE